MSHNFLIWVGYSLFAGVIACITLMFVSWKFSVGDIHNNIIGIMYLCMVLFAVISAFLAGWINKIHKGKKDFRNTGFHTWCFFMGFLCGSIMTPMIIDTILHPNAGLNTQSVIAGTFSGTIFILLCSLPFTAIACVIGTLVWESIVYLMRKFAKLPEKEEIPNP